MPYTTYNCDALTGGAARALDSYSIAVLVNGDRAFVIIAGEIIPFRYNSTGTAAENVATHPYIVRPDDYSTGGNWEEQVFGGGMDTLSITSAIELIIATGVITKTQTLHRIDTEADAASDDLDTINGGSGGDILIIRAENTARTVTLKDGTGNLELAGSDITLDDTDLMVILVYDGTLTKWVLAGGGGGGGIPASTFTQDAGIIVGTGAGTYAEETGHILRTSLNFGTMFPIHYERVTRPARTAVDALTIYDGTVINVNEKIFTVTSDIALELNTNATWDTGTALNDAARAGNDYYVYACDNSGTLALLVSANSTNPTGYTTTTSRKIGGFHCLCVAVGDVAGSFAARINSTAYALGDRRRPVTANSRYYICITAGTSAAAEPAVFTSDDTETGTTITDGAAKWKCEGHDLNDFTQGDIIPNSVWDLIFRADNLVGNAGLTYDPRTAGWEGIYLGSDDGFGGIQSVYGATILDVIDWNDYGDCLAKVGMIMESDLEFASLALGSNEETNITGSADPVTTGGHVDTASRRMISNIGCEDCAGVVNQWLKDQSYRLDGATFDAAKAWAWYNLPGAKGSLYRQADYGDLKLVAGGGWDYAANCGSRCRNTAHYRWRTDASLGGRGRSRRI